MVEPSKINSVANKYEEQNIKFRTFLKIHADYDKLDSQFLTLHNELFTDYDCCECNNCCKAYSFFIKEDEIAAISSYLNKEESDFINEYLVETDEDPEEGRYKTKRTPCPFLCGDGKCKIYECNHPPAVDFHIPTDRIGWEAC
jgi:hypothetical protein